MPFGKRNPFDEVDELLERLGHQVDVDAWRMGDQLAVDVADHDDRYVVAVDLPGYDKADIDVRLVAGDLRIAASRASETTEEDVNYLRQERRRESASRTIPLPEPVDEEEISARYAGGVLTVELPKLEAGGGTRIDVE